MPFCIKMQQHLQAKPPPLLVPDSAGTLQRPQTTQLVERNSPQKPPTLAVDLAGLELLPSEPNSSVYCLPLPCKNPRSVTECASLLDLNARRFILAYLVDSLTIQLHNRRYLVQSLPYSFICTPCPPEIPMSVLQQRNIFRHIALFYL